MTPTERETLDLLVAWVRKAIDPREVITRWPQTALTPVSTAWLKAVMTRPLPYPASGLRGYREALDTGSWAPRLRGSDDVAHRICVTALCATSADALLAGELERHNAAVEHPAFLAGGPERFEHPEAHLLLATAAGAPLERAVIVQLSWRDHAAAILAWAAGWIEELPPYELAADALLADLPPDERALRSRIEHVRPRPLVEILRRLAHERAHREALQPAAEAGDASAAFEHGVALERVKALRWLTEPWWPELALTPWRADREGLGSLLSPAELERARAAAIERLARV